MEAREIVAAGQHAGQDGQGAAAQERDESARIVACLLREASDRGQVDMRGLAGLVQTEPQSHLKRNLVQHGRLRQSRPSCHGLAPRSEQEARAVTHRFTTRVPRSVHVSEGQGRSRLARTSGGMQRQRATPASPTLALSPTAKRPRSLEALLLHHHPRWTVENGIAIANPNCLQRLDSLPARVDMAAML